MQEKEKREKEKNPEKGNAEKVPIKSLLGYLSSSLRAFQRDQHKEFQG